MPLTDIILLLNSCRRSEGDGGGREFRYVSVGNRIFAYWGGLRLQSFFIPVRDPDGGTICGHRAFLDVDEFNYLSGPAPDPGKALPADGAEAAELDRLVCTLHALNYLLQPERGTLFITARTGSPGDPVFAFEDILRPCGLLPKRVVLEYDGAVGGRSRWRPQPSPAGVQPTSFSCRC